MSNLDVMLTGSIDASLGSPCIVAKIIASLSDPYKSKLADLVKTRFADGGLSDPDLAKVMRLAGLKCSATMINQHRRGVCTCPTER